MPSLKRLSSWFDGKLEQEGETMRKKIASSSIALAALAICAVSHTVLRRAPTFR